MTTLELALTAGYLACLAPLALLGVHRGWTLLIWLRRGGTAPLRPRPEPAALDELPTVTVQLPIFNERHVAVRLLEAVAALDYPPELLEVQVLDDSDDDTTEVVASALRRLDRGAARFHHVRRGTRHGFKAGALAHGLAHARGALIAIFDADFVPPHDFLRRTVVEFADPRVGLVQARWGHTNRTQSLLTRIQALLLDGHFVVEQQARHIAGFLFNFNGTAGVFRRGCIEDAGGWQHDTLTEDLDLSYRAQLRGWRFVYLPTLCCPAELPTDMNSFLTQQHRWAKGSIQTGRKLLGAVWRAPLSGMAKLEGTFHLLGNIAFPLLLAVILTALPIHALRQASGQGAPALLGAIESAPLLLATLSVLAYYGTSQAALGRLGGAGLLRLPLVLVLGAGACVNNTAAVLGGLRRDPGEFRRTPKNPGASPAHSYRTARGALPFLELLLGTYAATTAALAYVQQLWPTAVFHGLFAGGLLWVGIRSLNVGIRRRSAVAIAALASCAHGTHNSAPIEPNQTAAELVVCQARIGKEHTLTEVVATTAAGFTRTELPGRLGMEFGVRVHPDGNRVVFARERELSREDSRELFTATLDRSSPEVRLTGNAYADDAPCWAPDGLAIAFSSAIAGSREIWRIDPDGSNPARLTAGFDDRDPDWHASGIVFSRGSTTGPARLVRIDANGANPTDLTDGGAGGPGTGDVEPAWSPDGRSVLFVRRLGTATTTLMRLAFGNPVPQPVGALGLGEDRWPRWSPHGDRIFVARRRPAAGLDGLRLWAMDADGGNAWLLIPDQRFAYLGFDPTRHLPAFVTPQPNAVLVPAADGTFSLQAGRLSQGSDRLVRDEDGQVLGIATELFEGREVAGLLFRVTLPVADPQRVAAVRCTVTAGLSRTDDDSFLRLALRNFVAERHDSILETKPTTTGLATYAFTTSSLAHIDHAGLLQLEVIGDLSPGATAELRVDYLKVEMWLRDRTP